MYDFKSLIVLHNYGPNSQLLYDKKIVGKKKKRKISHNEIKFTFFSFILPSNKTRFLGFIQNGLSLSNIIIG